MFSLAIYDIFQCLPRIRHAHDSPMSNCGLGAEVDSFPYIGCSMSVEVKRYGMKLRESGRKLKEFITLTILMMDLDWLLLMQ